jgi:hypothetical protein
MMRIKTALLCFVIGLLISMGTEGYARDSGQTKEKNTLAKVAGSPSTTRLNINNVSHWFGADLLSANDPRTGNSGFESPRGISATLATIFIDGLVYGGLVDDGRTPALRVGGQNYAIGTVAGAILPNRTAEDPDAADVRIYRIRKDYATADLSLDAAELGLDVATVRAQYATDWREWPSQKGAPWTGIGNLLDSGYLGPDGTTVLGAGNGVLDRGEDANSNGILDAGEDANGNRVLDGEFPGIAGADQVVWTVANDLSEGTVAGFSGSLPIGLEIQLAAWGYQRTDALGNMIFKQFKVIYKGTATTPANAVVDPMYICQWSDPDLGSYSDDFVGVDSTLSLFYCYNSSSVDGAYAAFGFPPPATGYDFFQGPLIPGDPGDVGIFNLQLRPGFRNLPMSSFAYFAAGATFSDPGPLGNYETTQEWWNLLRGFLPQSDFNNPTRYTTHAGLPTAFPLFGDPVTGGGDLDGVILSPADRRMLGVSGPFTLMVGDTQEVVLSTIFALGSDRLSSVAVLKFFDRTAQSTFDNLFQVIRPPQAPAVQASGFDGQILLNWATDGAVVAATEGQVQGSFSFEGYNVYQLKTSAPDLGPGNAIKLATFDVVNEVTTVLSEVFDQTSGVIIQRPVQIGTNSGIQRTFVVNRDAFRDRPLANDQDYFFAVTAYNATQDLAETNRAFESSPQVITVRAQKPRPGVRYTATPGQVIQAEHNDTGPSDGSAEAIVIDPSKVTGDQYKINFRDVGGETVWDLTNVSDNQVVLSEQTNQSGDANYLIVDGVQFVVIGPPPGVKQLDQFDNDDPSTWGWSIPSGTRRFTFAGGADGLHFEGFRGAIGWANPARVFGFAPSPGVAPYGSPVPPTEIPNVLLILATATTDGVFDPNDPNVSFGYRYLRRAAVAPALPEFAPFILNPSGGYAFQAFEKNVPIAAFDINVDPPRRLAVGFLENNVAGGTVDGKYWPPDFNVGDNTAGGGPREWLFIFDVDYSETADPAYSVDVLTNDYPIMYFCTFARRGNVPFSPNGTGTDQFSIHPNVPNSALDEFTVDTRDVAPSFNANQQKQDALELVNVFPNPYLGLNRLETSSTNRFVRFNHLPANSTVRIFNLAGTLVRTLDATQQVDQYIDWDLQNEQQLPVASGIYIARVEMPGIGSKNLKLVIVQEEQFLRTF